MGGIVNKAEQAAHRINKRKIGKIILISIKVQRRVKYNQDMKKL